MFNGKPNKYLIELADGKKIRYLSYGNTLDILLDSYQIPHQKNGIKKTYIKTITFHLVEDKTKNHSKKGINFFKKYFNKK